jgi:hypothetical protein
LSQTEKDMEPSSTLIDRIASSAVRRIAIMGLTRGAGKTTTLVHLLRGLQERGSDISLAAAGREEDDTEFTETPRGLTVPVRKGTVVATTVASIGRATARLERIEATGIHSPQGPVVIVRVLEDGEVEPVGPSSAHELRQVVEALGRHAAGHMLIEGSFNRRSFAAPGIADGLILAVGAALAPELERNVASTKYYLDLFSLAPCEPRAAEVFPVAETEGAAVLLGPGGTVVGGIPWKPGGNAKLLLGWKDAPFERVVLPRSVGDDFVIPLLRENLRFEMIVRDPMRVALSPVYYNAWKKRGGGIRVVHPTRVLALSLNPTNPAGPDQQPDEFLKAFRDGLPEVPAHDVVQEEVPNQPRRRWFGIGGLVGD